MRVHRRLHRHMHGWPEQRRSDNRQRRCLRGWPEQRRSDTRQRRFLLARCNQREQERTGNRRCMCSCRHTHPQVASSDDLGAGDLNFFNQWPAGGREAYLGMWPQSEVTAAAAGDDGGRFLLDVSADYLMNAVVPPRLKQLVPQAKVVVVLQVPLFTTS